MIQDFLFYFIVTNYFCISFFLSFFFLITNKNVCCYSAFWWLYSANKMLSSCHHWDMLFLWEQLVVLSECSCDSCGGGRCGRMGGPCLALPALWWVIKDLSQQLELHCILLTVITNKVRSVFLSSLSPSDLISGFNLSDSFPYRRWHFRNVFKFSLLRESF